MSVALESSAPPPVPVGTVVTFWPSVLDANPGTLWYRYRVRDFDSGFRAIRDYGPVVLLDWTASEHEGTYEIEVSVRNRDTGETATASALFEMTSRLEGDAPVISPTAHPLVFLYSAPPCLDGGRMRVEFQSLDGVVQQTPYKPCDPGRSMNFYLAGMRPESPYAVRHTVDAGSDSFAGPQLELTTPEASVPMPEYAVAQPPPGPIVNGILLQGPVAGSVVATDLRGNLLWSYAGGITSFTRAEPGGYFLGVGQDPTADQSYQFVREFDLAGTTIAETNAARVSEQLAALGRRGITAFHHEARRLPDGKLLVLASTEQIMTDVQGSGPVDVLGDMVLVLDQDLNVTWVWDAFDHLDPYRTAILGEVCAQVGGGCPAFYLAARANDWLHGNSLQLAPDGNIVLSIRHQDWVIKIDYRNGEGDGRVLWRLGKDGDFRMIDNDPWPWFSHQHDAQFDAEDPSILRVFDNGNTRYAGDPAARSRGQVLQLDEQNRTAKLVLNADLGAYSFALGSAQKLPNGNHHFDVGILSGSKSQSVEVDRAGNTVYSLHISVPVYRSFRVRDLYTP
jgi:hypothetical protein